MTDQLETCPVFCSSDDMGTGRAEELAPRTNTWFGSGIEGWKIFQLRLEGGFVDGVRKVGKLCQVLTPSIAKKGVLVVVDE